MPAKSTSAPFERTTLLLVDDSLVDLRLLMDMLASKGYRIIVAFEGGDGYRKALLNRPDLILMDVRMPGGDGFSCCRLLKSDPGTRDIPLIFLTAANEPEQRVEGLMLGAVDYVVKPFSEREVIARVSLHLDIARRLKTGEASARDRRTLATPLPDVPLARAAADYLAEHLASPPTPASLARILGTNETRLNAVFHNAFGMPVFAYVREERMRLARQFLVSTDIPVADIGEHVGYPNAANFSTAFKKRFGASPRELRHALRDGETVDMS